MRQLYSLLHILSLFTRLFTSWQFLSLQSLPAIFNRHTTCFERQLNHPACQYDIHRLVYPGAPVNLRRDRWLKIKLTFAVCCLLLLSASTYGQYVQTFSLSQPSISSPPSNSIDVLTLSGDTLWLGTSKGLGFTVGGMTWNDFTESAIFGHNGISAISVNATTVWTASAYSVQKDGETIQTGAGLTWSSDFGTNWNHVPQPVDIGTVDTLPYGANNIRALAVTVPQQNITYDVALTNNTVWIASFAGMLRKSTNLGQTWDRVILPPDNLDSITPNDTLDFDLSPSSGSPGLRGNLNHRVFSIYAMNDSTLWVGTAAGINKSTDGGISWKRFSHQNQTQPISGNFVVAIGGQLLQSKLLIWAATINAVGPDEQPGVSVSEDSGASWSTTLLGEVAHNIAFRDSVAYVATDRGVFRSDDFGTTWLRSGAVYDPFSFQQFTSEQIYAVAAQGDTIWVSGPDGLAYTIDTISQPFGAQWIVFRRFQPTLSTSSTYSYPSPFSPDDETVRIHYSNPGPTISVTIRIFDFAMQPVRTLIQNALRPGFSELDEIWDGTNDQNRLVANGVYFYRISIADQSLWGKVFVLK